MSKWQNSLSHHQVTFCDLEVRQPQRNMAPHRYSFQCLLNMNIFNEKVGLFRRETCKWTISRSTWPSGSDFWAWHSWPFLTWPFGSVAGSVGIVPNISSGNNWYFREKLEFTGSKTPIFRPISATSTLLFRTLMSWLPRDFAVLCSKVWAGTPSLFCASSRRIVPLWSRPNWSEICGSTTSKVRERDQKQKNKLIFGHYFPIIDGIGLVIFNFWSLSTFRWLPSPSNDFRRCFGGWDPFILLVIFTNGRVGFPPPLFL